MRRPMIFAVLAGLAATLAAIVVYSALKKREAELQKAVASTTEIAVAARDLPLGSHIGPESIKMTRWSRDSVPPGAVTDPRTIMNYVVRDSFVENEPIVMSRVFGGGKNPGILPLIIPPGMRAMSVPVDEVSDVAGFILPHSRVDVVVALTQTGDRARSKVVLQDVEVLAVAQEIEGNKDEPQVVKVVTLLVTPEQAERLALASNRGVLRLALRNYADDKIVLTAGSDVDSMLRAESAAPLPVAGAQATRAVSAQAAAGLAEVEVVRDGKRRQIISFLKGMRMSPPSDEQAAASVAPVGPAPQAAAPGGNPFGSTEGAPPSVPQAMMPGDDLSKEMSRSDMTLKGEYAP